MTSGSFGKSIAILFLAVLVLYLAGFYGCEHARHRKGPWELVFQVDAQGAPTVEVNQPRLGISAVKLVFAGEQAALTNTPQTVALDVPRKVLPFGRVLFDDLSFLPGVVTFDFFGHEVELLPRVLMVNRKEIPWQSGRVIQLAATDKPAEPFRPPTKPRRH